MDQLDPPTTEQIKADVQTLKAWTYSCPHLPNIDDQDWLETYLRNCKFRLEKTQRKLETYYKLKDKHPALLKNRDPSAPELLQVRRAITLAVSDRLTTDGHLLVYIKCEPDPSLLDASAFFKRFTMALDVILLDRLAPTGCMFVVDTGHFRFQHFLKIMTRMRSMVDILVSSYAERINAMHMISSSAILLQLIGFSLRFVPKKISERITIHTMKRDDVHLQIDASVLSSDFDGRGLSLIELEGKPVNTYKKTQQLLEKHKSWFQEQDRLCVELLKKRKNKGEER